ncbi:MAG: hypothetical protein N2C12_11205 [Planctomycetales bacterium]
MLFGGEGYNWIEDGARDNTIDQDGQYVPPAGYQINSVNSQSSTSDATSDMTSSSTSDSTTTMTAD